MLWVQRWDTHTDTEAPYIIEEEWLARVEQVVDWGLAEGLYVILGAHGEPTSDAAIAVTEQ